MMEETEILTIVTVLETPLDVLDGCFLQMSLYNMVAISKSMKL